MGDQIPEECQSGIGGRDKEKTYLCYILRSSVKPARTYSGSTNDIRHRLRQHNGEIKGGAVATKTDRPWKIACLVYGFSTRSAALRFEWFTKTKHSKQVYVASLNGGYNSIERRACLLIAAERQMDKREKLKYYVPDRQLSIYLDKSRQKGLPGTLDSMMAMVPTCEPRVREVSPPISASRSTEGTVGIVP